LRDAAGQVSALLGVTRDITERKLAEEQLLYELQLIRNITDSADECIFIADENGNVKFANLEAVRTFGFSLDELMGQSLHETLHHSYADGRPFPKSDCVLGRTRVSGSTIRNHEDVFFRKDGSPVIVECSNAPVETDEQRFGAVLIARDITERKRAEEALRAARDELELRVAERTAELTRSNALLREKDQHLTLAQRAGHAGLWSRDLTAGTSSMSPEWHELIGFPVDETPVSFAEFLDRVHPDDRERVEDLSLHQKIGDFDREFRIVHPIKGERWILSRGRRGISAEDGHLHMMGALIDITERKHAEQALRRSEERLQHALTVGRMGTWERDLRTGETKWDLRMYDAFEVALGTPVTLDAVYARIHPDDLSGIKAAIANTERLGVEYAQDFRVIRTDGQIHWYHVSGGLRYDRNGNATHIAGINFDITERKQAEEALRQSEERLQHALTVGSMGIWERNLRTGEEKWDRRTYEIFGIEAERSIDLETFFSRIHPEDLPAVKKAVLLTERTGAAYQCDYRVLKPDGNMAWIHANGGLRRDRDGTPAHLAGINFDITERRQAEEALRDSEARLRAILDHNPAPVFIKDTEGKYVHVNSRFEELFGLHGATSVGKTDADLFASEQAQAFQTNDRKVLDLGHAIQFEEVAQYFDGEHTSIVNKFPLRDGQGKIYALCGIATDITERKAAEEALRNLNEQLDQRVAQRTRELAESQARLRALVAELTKAEERERRRIAVELHDYLAQSLTATRMNLSRAEKFVSGSIGNNDLKEILYDVQSDLSDSINYTRTLIGELSPRVLYDLGLPAALGWLGEQMGRHGLSVEVDGPGDDFSLAENDAVFLFQCARELLWNVVKHGDTNRATVAYGRDGNRVSLAVVDNGQGFDPQAVDESGDGGTHLGLFSIRERVELRGGQVEIDSAPGVGAWVSIILPVDHNQEVSAKMVKPDTQLSAFGDAIKIVIVDDHKMVRQGLRRVLEEHDDFTIVGEAGDGAEAVAMARELEPHVVIMDVNLPTMSGIDATQGIMRERPSTIVIGLSFGSDSYVSQAMQAAGAVSCIAKERAVEDVRQAILDAVEGRRVGTAR
jgi:PAS domain S-box-containing protein